MYINVNDYKDLQQRVKNNLKLFYILESNYV